MTEMSTADCVAILEDEIGWCGCGDPDSAYVFLLGVLDYFREWDEAMARDRDKPPAQCAYPDTKAAFAEAPEGARYLIWYMLSRAGITEHGGSVPGWFTDKGRAFYAALKHPETVEYLQLDLEDA